MDDLEMNNSMEPDTIIFEDEDGKEYEFIVRDYFFYNGDEYALLTEMGQEADENGEEWGYRKFVGEIAGPAEMIFTVVFSPAWPTTRKNKQ